MRRSRVLLLGMMVKKTEKDERGGDGMGMGRGRGRGDLR